MEGLARIRLAAAGCLMAGTFIAASAQVSPSRSEAAVDSLLSPTPSTVRPLRFERMTSDLGTLREDGAPVSRRFAFTNRGGDTVAIERVGVGCHCLAASWTRGGIAPGAGGVVELAFSPKNHPGQIDAYAFVYVSGAGNRPSARLTLTGEVTPDAGPWVRFRHAMGALRLKQSEVRFCGLQADGTAVERILCGNAGERPLRLSVRLLPDFATFRTEPETIPPGGEADIVITVDASKIPGPKAGDITFPLVVEGVAGRPSERTLTVRIDRTDR